MQINMFIVAGFGLANLICAAMVMKMPYRRNDRIIPLMLTTVGLVAWIIGVAAFYNVETPHAAAVYSFFDLLVLGLAITAFNTNTYRVWALLLAVVTSFSILNAGVILIWDMPTYIQKYTLAALNNIFSGLQITLVIVSSLNETIRVQINRSRNKTNYFTHQS